MALARGRRRCTSPCRSRRPTTPAHISANCHTGWSGSGRWGRATLTVKPMSTVLSSVPRPGRTCRGSHRTSTAQPTRTMTVPTEIPVCSLMPTCSTSHGARPMSAARIRAIPSPPINSPATQRTIARRQRSRDRACVGRRPIGGRRRACPAVTGSRRFGATPRRRRRRGPAGPGRRPPCPRGATARRRPSDRGSRRPR